MVKQIWIINVDYMWSKSAIIKSWLFDNENEKKNNIWAHVAFSETDNYMN